MTGLQAFLTASIVLSIAYLAVVATLAIVAALRIGGRREDAGDDHDALAVSRFTIPVSIIVPISSGGEAVRRTVSSLLDLNYPEFEVIVVGDGLSQAAVDELTRDWQLEAREFFYRQTISTSEVRRIYRSADEGRLMVIDKAGTGYSDTLNCGVNVARYRYVMPVDIGVTFDREALLRVMTAALRDPAAVAGATNHVERGADGGTAVVATARPAGRIGPTAGLFQRLASARSLMDSRLVWQRMGATLGPPGAVAVWRRDALIKVNGFAATAADPAMDMMFRLQTRDLEGGARIDRGADVFGKAAPQPLGGALKLAGRRQRAAMEILAASLRGQMLATRSLTYFVVSECLTPLAQTWVVLATLAGVLAGWFSWTLLLLALVLLSFGNAAVTVAALLLRGSMAGAPEEPELRKLVAAGPAEFVFYRPVLALARLAAVFSFGGR